MRGMIRDMLQFHVQPFTLPAMKVRQARNLLDFLGKAASPRGEGIGARGGQAGVGGESGGARVEGGERRGVSRRGSGPEATDREPMVFETPDGITLQARDAIVQAAMMELGDAWPKAIPFNQLLERASERM